MAIDPSRRKSGRQRYRRARCWKQTMAVAVTIVLAELERMVA